MSTNNDNKELRGKDILTNLSTFLTSTFAELICNYYGKQVKKIDYYQNLESILQKLITNFTSKNKIEKKYNMILLQKYAIAFNKNIPNLQSINKKKLPYLQEKEHKFSWIYKEEIKHELSIFDPSTGDKLENSKVSKDSDTFSQHLLLKTHIVTNDSSYYKNREKYLLPVNSTEEIFNMLLPAIEQKNYKFIFKSCDKNSSYKHFGCLTGNIYVYSMILWWYIVCPRQEHSKNCCDGTLSMKVMLNMSKKHIYTILHNLDSIGKGQKCKYYVYNIKKHEKYSHRSCILLHEKIESIIESNMKNDDFFDEFVFQCINKKCSKQKYLIEKSLYAKKDVGKILIEKVKRKLNECKSKDINFDNVLHILLELQIDIRSVVSNQYDFEDNHFYRCLIDTIPQTTELKNIPKLFMCINNFMTEFFSKDIVNSPTVTSLFERLTNFSDKYLDTVQFSGYYTLNHDIAIIKKNITFLTEKLEKMSLEILLNPTHTCIYCNEIYCLTCDVYKRLCTCEKIESEDDLLTKQKIYEITKPCPKCGIRIQKNDGCNHMICGGESGRHDLLSPKTCGQDWCWLCNLPYPENFPHESHQCP